MAVGGDDRLSVHIQCNRCGRDLGLWNRRDLQNVRCPDCDPDPREERDELLAEVHRLKAEITRLKEEAVVQSGKLRKASDEAAHGVPVVRREGGATFHCKTCHRGVDVALWCEDGQYECLPCRYPQALKPLRWMAEHPGKGIQASFGDGAWHYRVTDYNEHAAYPWRDTPQDAVAAAMEADGD